MIRLFRLSLICLCLTGSAPAAEPDRSIVVWRDERVADEWWVPWSYNGVVTVSRHATREEALRLYAVLAAKMLGGER